MLPGKYRGVEFFHESKEYSMLENETTGTAKKVILSMIRYMEKDMNQIIVNGATLDSIVKDTGLSVSQVRKAVSELKGLRLIEPTGQIRAEYIVNPLLAIKGEPRKVWRFYGSIEQAKGNSSATKMNEPLTLEGKSLPLRDADYTAVGKYIKRAK